MLLEQRCAIVDLETTGMSPSRHTIIEYATLIVGNDQEPVRHQQLIDPQRSVPPAIVQLTGISAHMLIDQPKFFEIAEALHAQLNDCIFIAHNASFDLRFLQSQFAICGLRFNPPVLCTVKLARALFPEWPRHNLDTVRQRIGFSTDGAHRAMADVEATYAFIRYAIERHGLDTVNVAASRQLKTLKDKLNITQELIDSVPDTVGVYRFYGKNGELLYIGKSKHMRQRIRQHFARHGTHAMRWANTVYDIDYTIKGGELSALLQENHEIKQRQPIYNRRQRRLNTLWVIRISETDDYAKIHIEAQNTTDWQGDTSSYGLFKSKKQAKQWLEDFFAEEQLCLTVSGLEQGSGPCFARQLNRCRGACEGLESIQQYNLRLRMLMQRQLIEPWPYEGPIVHIDDNPEHGVTEAVIVDRWAWLHTERLAEQEYIDAADYNNTQRQFDKDMYPVLRRLLQPIVQHHVTTLSDIET